MPSSRVVIIGQGYVGLPLAMRAVDAGFDVVGIDLDTDRVKALGAATSYVEDVSDERLAAALASGRYQASDDYATAAGFDIAVVSVPTPLSDGAPDLRFVEDAADALAPHVTEGSTIILESTTYPGTTDELFGPMLEAGSGLAIGQFHLGYSPERIDPGNQTFTLQNTPKVVSGVDPASLAKVRGFFDHIVDQTVPVSTTKEAELTKLLENTFRHVNIALVNELAMFANELGIDVWEAIDAASTKPFGYLRFTPGPGVGGHCLPIDPSYLSWRVKRATGSAFRFVELANDVNEHMPAYVVERLLWAMNERGMSLKNRRVLLLGLAYKKNTGDAREAPSTHVAAGLTDAGATVVACDPHVLRSQIPRGVTLVDFDVDEIAAADAVVMLVDHDDFDVSVVTDHASYAFDTRAVLPRGPNVELL